MDVIQRVVEAGRPVNAEQLRLMLEGCSIQVTPTYAESLYALYAMPSNTIEDTRPDPNSFHLYH